MCLFQGTASFIEVKYPATWNFLLKISVCKNYQAEFSVTRWAENKAKTLVNWGQIFWGSKNSWAVSLQLSICPSLDKMDWLHSDFLWVWHCRWCIRHQVNSQYYLWKCSTEYQAPKTYWRFSLMICIKTCVICTDRAVIGRTFVLDRRQKNV